jgi:hypothetical protein
LANDPVGLSTDYCQARAEEARVKAEAMTDLEARKTMLRVAEMWNQMAAAAERRSRWRRLQVRHLIMFLKSHFLQLRPFDPTWLRLPASFSGHLAQEN